MKVSFNWLYWAILLGVTAVLGCFSNVNNDGIPNFGASVVYGLTHGDVVLILTAVLSLVLLLWLVLAAITGELSARKSLNERPAPRE